MEEQDMMTMVPRVTRLRHSRERGLTLIELVVSIGILAVIGSVIGTAFSVGLTLVMPGGPETRLFAANNLMELEQALGQDGARAACVQVPGGTKYGSCSASHFGLVTCPSTHLCFGWPQVSDSSCHVADYAIGASTIATRAEYKAGTATAITSGPLARQVRASITISSVSTVTPPGESYTWVRAIAILISSTGVTNGPSQTMTLHPVATDPAGASAAITPGGAPC
jgi:prepilin-type N-terminal cleavage/methylation domain-containing protein